MVTHLCVATFPSRPIISPLLICSKDAILTESSFLAQKLFNLWLMKHDKIKNIELPCGWNPSTGINIHPNSIFHPAHKVHLHCIMSFSFFCQREWELLTFLGCVIVMKNRKQRQYGTKILNISFSCLKKNNLLYNRNSSSNEMQDYSLFSRYLMDIESFWFFFVRP